MADAVIGSMYGLTRLERSMAHYLAAGVLKGMIILEVVTEQSLLPVLD